MTRGKWLLVISMCTACALAGGACGTIAGGAYRLVCYEIYVPRMVNGQHIGHVPAFNLALVGGVIGAISGALLAIRWALVMQGRCRVNGGRKALQRGASLGARAGVVCTVLVHTGIIAAMVMDTTRPGDPFDLVVLAIGLICGVIVGLLIGAVGGFFFERPDDTASPDQPGSSAQDERA